MDTSYNCLFVAACSFLLSRLHPFSFRAKYHMTRGCTYRSQVVFQLLSCLPGCFFVEGLQSQWHCTISTIHHLNEACDNKFLLIIHCLASPCFRRHTPRRDEPTPTPVWFKWL